MGELGPDDSLDWGGMPGGNIPSTGMLPDLYDTKLYLLVRQLAWAGEYGGRDPDWDASALRVNGSDLTAILTRSYGAQIVKNATGDLRIYCDFAASLGERQVALMAVAF